MKKNLLFGALGAASVLIVTAMLLASLAMREAQRDEANQAAHAAAEKAIIPAPPAAPKAPIESSPFSQPDTHATPEPTAKPAAPPKAPVPAANPAGSQTANAKDPPLSDPLARAALSFVGEDPEAEQYWVEAINDPSMPPRERQDLIEDLNEDGLSDPKHPSPDDLPLILNRIVWIEQLAPFAMDKVNADAFQEAYKDLINLADLATGGGHDVK
jgi:hypothetical protein